MTTKEAWFKLINTKGIETVLGYSKNRLYTLRSLAKHKNEYPFEDTMDKDLKKAGLKVVQEKEWSLK